MQRSRRAEYNLEAALFASRWLLAPFYAGLVVALGALLVVFTHEIVNLLPQIFTLDETTTILWILSLIDLSLAANLLLMVVFAGYENFVSKLDIGDHPDRPRWISQIDFSGMKLKLIASIVAISAIHLLRAFMSVESTNKENLKWLVIVHLTFVVSGVLLALMDYVTERAAIHRREH
jgi:uncharacterized protein (TIGR00645 family)